MKFGDYRHLPQVEEMSEEVAKAIRRIGGGVVAVVERNDGSEGDDEENEGNEEDARTGMVVVRAGVVAAVKESRVTDSAGEGADASMAIVENTENVNSEEEERRRGEDGGVGEHTLREVARIAIEVSMEEAAKDWTKAMAVWMLWFDQVCSPLFPPSSRSLASRHPLTPQTAEGQTSEDSQSQRLACPASHMSADELKAVVMDVANVAVEEKLRACVLMDSRLDFLKLLLEIAADYAEEARLVLIKSVVVGALGDEGWEMVLARQQMLLPHD